MAGHRLNASSSTRWSAKPRSSAARGFTMVELMITIAVMAILIAIAVPSFDYVRNVSRLSGTANEVVAGLQLARSEAIRRNATVVFCRSEDGVTCSGVAGQWGGWLVASDANGDGDFADAGERIRTEVAPANVEVRPSAALTALNNRISFRGDGMAAGAGGNVLLTASIAVCMTTDTPAENERAVRIVSGGRVAVERVDRDGNCQAPEDGETS